MSTTSHYRAEIAQMMFVFGDTSEPADDTVALVEDLTRAQIAEVVIQAIAQAQKRGSKTISAEDLIFLIRHDVKKTNRMRQFLSWKDVRKNVKDKGPSATQDLNSQEDAEDILDNEPSKLKPRKKIVKLSWELVNSLSNILDEHESNKNEEDEEDEIIDEEARQAYEEQVLRLRAADDVTRDMSKEEYVYYSECRQASFTFKKAKKFREWSGLQLYYKLKTNGDVLDILGFLAYECVARLTETGLQVKAQWNERDKLSMAQNQASVSKVGLFGRNTVEQAPLGPRHIQEAFRRLQTTTFPMNNFKGGMIRSQLTIF
ncbi:Transcription initiation protein spt3 [Physocladia obscura]|uniref:Transcription initiation protein spt3 n=1 Tax=Physocladia obscura TaxID=109957 RepID=A0AAD5XFR7_9FUNG|nr:Transcription initiation protein spt3 [Physocladia obscura]